ncbi:MAG: beta-phosphoglucomutase family hydrolase [Candidatus Omnitrophota bacterium]
MGKGKLQGAIFDLDGVLVDTVPLHFAAWKRMFREYGKEITFEDYKQKVDGIPRLDGARAFLADLPEAELHKAADRKQSYFLEQLEKQEIPVYDSTVRLMRALRERGVKVAVISSSKNCPYVLRRIGVDKELDLQISGSDITKGKPDPQIFLLAVERLGLSPEACIVFEDAALGVEAAKRARMVCVGIDRHGDPERLRKADWIVNDLDNVSMDQLEALLGKTGSP